MVIQKTLTHLIKLKGITNVMAVYAIKYLSTVWVVPLLLSSGLNL